MTSRCESAGYEHHGNTTRYANQKQRSLLDPYNSVMIGYFRTFGKSKWSPIAAEYKKREHQSLRGLVFDNHREVEAEHKANTLLAL